MKNTRKKKSGLDYTRLTPVEVYDHVLKGTILTFANGYVIPENMKPILRELVLNRLKLTREEICDKLNYAYLRQFCISGSRKAFNNSIYELIEYCFPEFEIKPWELKKSQTHFGNKRKTERNLCYGLLKKKKLILNLLRA